MNKPLISVVICTKNRPRLVSGAIESIINQDFSQAAYELVIVNNGSDEDTQSIVMGYAVKYPWIHCLHDKSKSISEVKNTGWRNTKGDYVAYLDDDAIADPSWLKNLIKGFEVGGENTACVGGKVILEFESPRPSWLTERIFTYYSALDWGDEPMMLPRGKAVVGANVCFRRTALEQFGGFNKIFKFYGDETYLLEKLTADGKGICYQPSAFVRHRITRHRLNKFWIFKRWFLHGFAHAFLQVQLSGFSWRSRRVLLFSEMPKAAHSLGQLLVNIVCGRCMLKNEEPLIQMGYFLGLLIFRRYPSLK